MILLEVPFAEKDAAKSLGARWNPQKKKWYVPDDLVDDLSPFEKWLPSQIMDSPTQPEAVAANEAQKGIPLSHLMHQVQNALRKSFAGAIWVTAEVANLNERRGHWYFELSETTEAGQQLASCRAMIWQSQATRILEKFSQQTGSELASGQKILVLAEVSFHEKFGFSLVIQDIDPSFTLGELEANLQAIRQQLINEKLYDRNKQFKLPSDFFRLAVIAPPSAAGLGDFRADANLLEQEGLCEFKYFYSAFQGELVESEMASAFEAFEALHQANPFDGLIILRGGGAKLDLQPLNSYLLAKTIAELSLPVMTGIGHERDSTILDEVAAVRFDTPSKVIAGVRQTIFTSAQQAKHNWLIIEKSSQAYVQQQKQQLVALEQAVRENSLNFLRQQKQLLLPTMVQIEQTGLRVLNSQKHRIEQLFQAISMQSVSQLSLEKQQLERFYDIVQLKPTQLLSQAQQSIKRQIAFILSSGPKTQLSRGFALIKDYNGVPITSVQKAVTEPSLQIHLNDGALDAKPTKILQLAKDEK